MSSSSNFKKYIVYAACFIALAVLIGIDLANSLQSVAWVTAIPVSQLKSDGLPPNYSTKVALVRSDDSKLAEPASLNTVLSYSRILNMVHEVLDLSGDLKPLLFPGAKVVIKPDIVELAERTNGVNTDPFVVEGLIRWMEEQMPGNLNYTVAEGPGGWLADTWRNTKYNTGRASVADGFAIAGYTDMIQRLVNDGISAKMLDANFGPPDNPLQGIRLVPVPEFMDFPEYPSYWVHEVYLDADVLINVPVMKIHTPQITICLKNYIGIAAGARYGTDKGAGGFEPGDPIGLHQGWPKRNSVERELVDLASIAPSDYCLVDALVCKERHKTATDPSVRRNMVVAGTDMVAVDAVCARLMGLNPDNIPQLWDASREGLGTMDEKQIAVVGEHSIEDSMYYFERSKDNFQGGRGHFGLNNRIWLLNSADGIDLSASYLGMPDENVIASPNAGGWTEPICFSDDYIDFEAWYGPEDNKVYYAFCWATVPEEQDAELWISHDEPCAVWIGGAKVYESKTSYKDPALPVQSSAIVHLAKGRQPLLVKLVDRTKSAPFVLNLCRILPSTLPDGKATYANLRIVNNYRRYEGTRVFGLKFDANGETDIPSWRSY